MKFKNFFEAQMGDERIKVEFTEPEASGQGRTKILYVWSTSQDPNILGISDAVGKNTIKFHKAGIEKLIQALKKKAS